MVKNNKTLLLIMGLFLLSVPLFASADHGDFTNNDGASTTPAAGDWNYIDFGSNQGSSTINNAVIRYGGSTLSLSSEISADGGFLTVSNSQIASSSQYGIKNIGATTTAILSEFNNNGYGIYVSGGSVNISSSTIHNNSTDGVFNNLTTTSSAIAEHNYWNASSGPHNIHSNPSGTGDNVSDHVDFSNWLTTWP